MFCILERNSPQKALHFLLNINAECQQINLCLQTISFGNFNRKGELFCYMEWKK